MTTPFRSLTVDTSGGLSARNAVTPIGSLEPDFSRFCIDAPVGVTTRSEFGNSRVFFVEKNDLTPSVTGFSMIDLMTAKTAAAEIDPTS